MFGILLGIGAQFKNKDEIYFKVLFSRRMDKPKYFATLYVNYVTGM